MDRHDEATTGDDRADADGTRADADGTRAADDHEFATDRAHVEDGFDPDRDLAALRSHCAFDDRRVYLLVALSRDKDNPGVEGPAPAIRKVVADADQFDRKAAELAHATDRFDRRYRLYCTVNARDVVDAAVELRRRTDRWLQGLIDGEDGAARGLQRLDSEFKSVLQSDDCRATRNFLFDVDDATAAEADRLRARLTDRTTVSLARRTPNGYHLVTDPFDHTALDADVEFELKTDGMVFVAFLSGR